MLIGQPYGSVFEVSNGKITKVEGKLSTAIDVDIGGGDEPDEAETAKLLATDASASNVQALASSDIDALRAQGASGHEIISALVENNAAWSTKTEFSKAKYLKRKAGK